MPLQLLRFAFYLCAKTRGSYERSDTNLNPEEFGLSCAMLVDKRVMGMSWVGGSSLFKHDIWSLAQAVGVFRGHAAVCDVVGVQTQMLQTGEAGDSNILAETWQVKLCGDLGKLRVQVRQYGRITKYSKVILYI